MSGVVTYAAGNAPAANAIVWSPDTPAGPAAHTDTAGHYALVLPAGQHDVRASTAGCTEPVDAVVDLGASDATANFSLTARVLPFGLSCTSAPVNFLAAKHKIALGNKSIVTKKLTLPFTFSFGGLENRSVLVSTSGRIDLLPHGWRASNTANETSIEVVNVVQRENNADSAVLYSVSGTKPNRVFVAEWRDLDASSFGNHLTYEAQLHENGDVDLVHSSIPAAIDDSPRTLSRNTNDANPPFFVFAPQNGDDPPLDGVAIHLAAP